MPGETAVWVVMRAVHPTWCMLQVPQEIGELLGARPEELAKLTRPAHAIAFLDRGPSTVRVIGVHRSADLLAREMAKNRVVGTAQMSAKGVFNLPDAVEQHLGLKVYPRKDSPATSTDDTVAWLLPEEEYYRYRREEREKESPASGEEYHVYLVRSLFPGLRPSVEVMEGGGTAGGRSFLAKAAPAHKPLPVGR